MVLTNAGPFTYDGTAKGTEYSIKDGTKLLVAGRDYAVSSVKYKVWDETNESWLEDEADSAIAAGKYQLVVTLTEGSGNYEGMLTSAEFEIRKAAPTANPTPSAAKNLVYNGGEQVLVARINDSEAATPEYPEAVGGTIKYALTETSRKPADFTDVKDDAADVKGRDAKTYYVWWWIEGDANHSTTDPKCLTVKIAKQGELTVQLDPAEVDYTGAAISNPGAPKFYLNSTEVTLTESTADQTKDYKVTYQKKTGSSWRTVSEVKDVGEYKIIFALEGNYTGTLNAAFKVNQAVSAVSAPEADNRTYDGTSKALLRAPATVTTPNDSSTVQYAVGSDGAAAPASGWSESIPQRTNAGTYYVWYRSSGDANYKASEPAFTAVTISPKNVENDDNVTLTVSPNEFIYNGRAQVPANVTVMDGGKTLGSGSYGISYMSGSEAAAADSIKDVGTYKVVVTFTGNYEGTKEAEFQIKPVSAAVVLPPTAIEDLVYDGTAKALATAGSCLNGTMKYAATTDEAEPTSWSEDLPRETNAGRYYVWYKASGDANYTDSAAAYIIVEIAPKNAIGNGNITAAAVPDSFEYSGNPRTPSVSVMDGTDTVDPAYYDISWQKIDGSMWVNVNEDEIVAVATYKAAVTFKGNYSGSRDALFTITKATPVLSQEPTPANPTYNGEPQALLTSIGATNDGRLYVAVSDSSETAPVTGWSETSPKATEAGTYYIWYRIVGDDNHKDLAAACWRPVTIGKAAGNITVTADRTKFAYDGTAKSPNVKVVLTKDGTKTELAENEYSIAYFAKQEGDEYDSVGKADVTEIGEYKLVVTAKNYGGAYEVAFEITGEPFIVGHTLVLSGSIGVNFYVDLPAGDRFVCESMTFEVNGETKEALFDSSARSSEGFYRFTCHVNSIQMADEITPTLHYVQNGELKTLTGEPYSVLAYVREAQRMDFDDKTVALIRALADYGYYVQKYLPAGASHIAMMERPFHSINDTDTARALAAVGNHEITMLRGRKIENASLSLILDSDTAIRLYFTPVAGHDGDAAATVDGQTTFVDTDDSGRFIVEIPDIAANWLARKFDVRLTTENDTTTMKLSVLSYVKLVLENSENEAERNAMTALYDYYAAAAAYKA